MNRKVPDQTSRDRDGDRDCSSSPVQFLQEVQLLLDLSQHRVLLVLQSYQLLTTGVDLVTPPQTVKPVLKGGENMGK